MVRCTCTFVSVYAYDRTRTYTPGAYHYARAKRENPARMRKTPTGQADIGLIRPLFSLRAFYDIIVIGLASARIHHQTPC